MRATGRAVTAIGAACLALAGCGGGGEEERIRSVVEEFVEAGNAREFDRFCELLTEEAREGLARFGEVVAEGEEATCEETLSAQAGEERGEAEVTVEEVRIDGGQAAVDLSVETPDRDPGEQTLELEREGDEWRVAQFGDEH